MSPITNTAPVTLYAKQHIKISKSGLVTPGNVERLVMEDIHSHGRMMVYRNGYADGSVILASDEADAITRFTANY